MIQKSNRTTDEPDTRLGCWARIIVVSYNSGDDLQKCVDHLQSQTFPHFEVVIVDNASPDDAVEKLKLPDHRFKIVEASTNFGFAAGSNLGANGANCPWLVMLNPDAWPNKDWLENLRQAAIDNPGFAVLGSTILTADKSNTLESFGDMLTIYGLARPCANGLPVSSIPTENVEVFSCCAAGAAYKRETFELMSGFDESFFCYLEDVDLAYRMRLAGYRCLQIPSAKIVHFGSSSSDKTPNFRTYYSHRNNLRLILKNTPLLLLLIMLPCYVASQSWLSWRNRKRDDRSVRSKATSDALKAMPDTLKMRATNLKNISSSSIDIAKRLGWSKRRLRGKSYLFWKVE